MNKNNLTCKQRVTLTFSLAPVVTTIEGWQSLQEADSRSIQKSAELISRRFAHIAEMIDCLTAVHEEWVLTRKKDQVTMETENFDFQQITDILAKNEFQPQDYRIRVDYERKWGIL